MQRPQEEQEKKGRYQENNAKQWHGQRPTTARSWWHDQRLATAIIVHSPFTIHHSSFFYGVGVGQGQLYQRSGLGSVSRLTVSPSS